MCTKLVVESGVAILARHAQVNLTGAPCTGGRRHVQNRQFLPSFAAVPPSTGCFHGQSEGAAVDVAPSRWHHRAISAQAEWQRLKKSSFVRRVFSGGMPRAPCVARPTPLSSPMLAVAAASAVRAPQCCSRQRALSHVQRDRGGRSANKRAVRFGEMLQMPKGIARARATQCQAATTRVQPDVDQRPSMRVFLFDCG